MPGFAALYAQRLHVPRVAAARQAVLWMLECAPGVPSDAPLSISDLGAGTCAACLGAQIALHEHAGEEQDCRLWPIDVASSSGRFRRAFEAMTKPSLNGRPALMPEQAADQYLTSAAPGVSALVRELFGQLERRTERQPHLLLASFSLHYLDPDERQSFFALLASLLHEPLLLLIIKGVGEKQRPNPQSVRSVHFGIHYVTGEDRSPRVVEAHLALLLPTNWAHAAAAHAWLARVLPAAGAKLPTTAALAARPIDDTPTGAKLPTTAALAADAALLTNLTPSEALLTNLTPSERWVLQTYSTLERRCERDGLRTGVTIASNS
jgi:hypothetical protein